MLENFTVSNTDCEKLFHGHLVKEYVLLLNMPCSQIRGFLLALIANPHG